MLPKYIIKARKLMHILSQIASITGIFWSFKKGLKIIMVRGTPTVVPFESFNPTEDAEALRNAMKGLGTDEDAIIDILGRRTNRQRQQIADEYKSCYGKDLIKKLKKEVRGDFEDALVALMTPSKNYMATEVHEAIKGLGTDEDALIEILAGCSNEEMEEIAEAYQELYDTSLEDAVAGDTSGDFKSLLVALVQGSRKEGHFVDEDTAKADAATLYEAGEGQWGTDESEFIKIMCRSSYPHLNEVQKQYKKLTGNSLKKAVEKEFSGHMQKALCAILACSKNEQKYYAERLYKSMEGFGTREKPLIRIIVSRSEIDLGDVKQEFMKKYEKSLEEAVANDTGRDFKKLLLALL
ncbi:annexin B9-like isoform X1 [Artemia franciscana]|uniref:annexin B9-like isoform X1 n=1 Tax=Artemia franciscana TaxID=6661 RepID=UPI0032D9E90D